MNKKLLLLLPLALFGALLGFLLIGLRHDPHDIPSPLLNKAAPAFALPQLDDPAARFSPQQLRGKVWLLNVWASWCESCREEHPILVEYAHSQHVPLVGLDYKDDAVDARNWLARFGNPYDLVAVDTDGRVGIDYGVYGVPETYVIDGNGTIVHKHTGPVTRDVLDHELLPLLGKLAR